MQFCKVTAFLMLWSFPFHGQVTGSEDCSGNWTLRGSVCYLFENDNHLNWEQASTYCQSKGGLLAEPVNEDENEMITSKIRMMICSFSTSYWIGVKRGNDDKFDLSSSNQPVSFTDWRRDQPDNYRNNEDCVEIECSTYLWNDNTCSNKQRFICQKGVVTTSTTATTTTTSTTSTTSTTTTSTPTTPVTSTASSKPTSTVYYNQTDLIEISTLTLRRQQVTDAQSKGHRPLHLSVTMMVLMSISQSVREMLNV